MTMKVLQNKLQISEAREELVRKGVSHLDPVDTHLKSILRRLRILNGLVMGDLVKSWDVLATVNFIKDHVQKNEHVLDIGCYASEILLSLYKLDYSNLTGVDLNPKLGKMPYRNCIRYETCDFMKTRFVDDSFKVITAISVIEHGLNSKGLLLEISRILQPGGYFIASFDYWPEKINTDGIKFFGMNWNIFSKNEVSNFLEEAGTYGLFPVGEMEFNSNEKTIDCAGKQYTFGWLVLRKLA